MKIKQVRSKNEHIAKKIVGPDPRATQIQTPVSDVCTKTVHKYPQEESNCLKA